MIQFTIKILLFLVYISSANIVIASKAANNNEVQLFTNYLASLKSVAMDFSQIDSRGQSARGKLVISKPHRFRINYYPPYPLLLLGNKSEVIMYDYALEQTTRIDAKENIFNFLLVDSKDWEKNFRIDDGFEVDGNITMKLYNYQTDRTISITLHSNPLELRQIMIDEPDGNSIEVLIENVQYISTVDKDLFLLPNPEIFGKPSRLKKQEIEKKYH